MRTESPFYCNKQRSIPKINTINMLSRRLNTGVPRMISRNALSVVEKLHRNGYEAILLAVV